MILLEFTYFRYNCIAPSRWGIQIPKMEASRSWFSNYDWTRTIEALFLVSGIFFGDTEC